MHKADGAAEINGVPQDDCVDDEIEAGGAVGHRLGDAVAQLAELTEEHGARERMTAFAFVQNAGAGIRRDPPLSTGISQQGLKRTDALLKRRRSNLGAGGRVLHHPGTEGQGQIGARHRSREFGSRITIVVKQIGIDGGKGAQTMENRDQGNLAEVTHPAVLSSGPFVPSEAQLARVAHLTIMQRRCAELVGNGSSKIIAKQLGISHHTVDQHLKEACKRLGVQTRVQVSATVAAAKSPHPQLWGYEASSLVIDAGAGMFAPPDHPIEAKARTDRVCDAGSIEWGRPAPIPIAMPKSQPGEGEVYSLAQTLNWVLRYALVMAILAAASVSIGSGFNEIGNYIEKHIRNH